MTGPAAAAISSNPKTATHLGASDDFVTLTIYDQLFGIPVLEVQDILGPQRITHVPLAPSEIIGSLNLRGRIVTALDVRIRLNLPPRPADMPGMSVVVQKNGELYSLIVDQVGDVMGLPAAAYEKNPPTLPSVWKDVSKGIYRLENKLLIALDIGRLLRADDKSAG